MRHLLVIIAILATTLTCRAQAGKIEPLANPDSVSCLQWDAYYDDALVKNGTGYTAKAIGQIVAHRTRCFEDAEQGNLLRQKYELARDLVGTSCNEGVSHALCAMAQQEETRAYSAYRSWLDHPIGFVRYACMPGWLLREMACYRYFRLLGDLDPDVQSGACVEATTKWLYLCKFPAKKEE